MVLQLLIVSPKVDLPSSLPLILCRACLVALRWAVLYMYLHSWPHIVTLMVDIENGIISLNTCSMTMSPLFPWDMR